MSARQKGDQSYPMTEPPGRGLALSMFKQHHAGAGAKRYADGNAHFNAAEHQPAHGRTHGNANGHAES